MAIPGNEFLILMEAERKTNAGEALTDAEVAIIKKHGLPKRKICGCGCGKPLEPRIDGERHRVGGEEVNSDCYYDKFGDALESFPIGGLGIRRRG